MMRLGGVKDLRILGTGGETSDFTPSVVGWGSDGSAMAGKSGEAKIVPTFSTSRELSRGNGKETPYFLAGRWVDANLSVNLDEIQNRIREKDLPDRSPEAWGTELDQAIRNGVANIGVQHLLFDSNSIDAIHFTGATTTGEVMGAGPVTHIGGLSLAESATVGLLTFHGLINIVNRASYHVTDYDSEGFRWSAFTGPQIDRACLLKGMAQSVKVVKSL
ncbi:MAG: hypothetical protein ACREHC_06085 [Candidatus Levyibacteriota bacterium]